MDTPLHDFTGLSEQTIDLLWFRADQLTGNRDSAFAAVLALHRAELKIAALTAALQEIAVYPLNVEGYNSLGAIRLRFVAMQTKARSVLHHA